MASTRTQNARRNIYASIANKSVSMLMPFVTRTAIIYFVGVLYLGLNGLFTSILSVLSLAELGVGAAMVFSMYEPIAKNDDETVCALLNLYKKIYRIIGTVILGAGLLFTPFVTKVIHGEIPSDTNIYILYLISLSNTVVSYFLFAYKTSLLAANQRMDVTTNITTILSIVVTIVQIALLAVFRNYYAYCIVTPISTIAGNLIRSRMADKMFPQYKCAGQVSHELKQEIKKRVFGLAIYRISSVMRYSLDSLVLSAFLGLAALAKYNNYFVIMNAIIGIMNIVTANTAASVGNSIVLESQEKNYRDFRKIQLIFMWLAGFFTVGMFCMYQPFMRVWVGEKLMFDDLTMTTFCVYFFTNKWGDICYLYRQSAGLWWEDRYRPIVEAVVNLALNIILVQIIGVKGVMLSTIIGLVFINSIWGSRILFKHYFTDYKQSKYLLELVWFTLCTAVACAACGAVCNFFPQADRSLMAFVYIGIRGIICTVLANVIFWIGYRKLPQYAEMIELAKRIVKFR